jgi:hypothetical protein
MAYKFLNGIDLANQKAVNVADPTNPTDVANKQYVDNVARGLSWKDTVQAASTGNVTLATPGTTMDGVTLTSGRVLLMAQTNPIENGIYDWTGGAAALVRSSDANSAGELRGGTAVTVTGGTVNGDKVFQITSPDGPVVIGTDAMTWGPLGGGGATYTAGNGLQLVGSEFSVKTPAASGLIVDGTGVRIDGAVIPRKYAANVGNSTSAAIVHNLGTADVQVTVYETGGGKAEVQPDVIHTDANTVTLVYAVAPGVGVHRAVVIG